jgi:hypothetical protein
MTLRTIVLVLSVLGIPLALLVLVLPIAFGYGGYDWQVVPGTPYARVYFADPSGPAARAGLRVGDEVIPTTGAAFVQENSGPVGTVVHEHVAGRNGKITVVSFAFVPFSGVLLTQQLLNKVVRALTALATFVIAVLVLLRARNQRVGARAAAVLLLSGLTALAGSAAFVCGNAWCAEILGWYMGPLLAIGAGWAMLWLLAIFPQDRTRLRVILAWLWAVPMATALLASYGHAILAADGNAADGLDVFFQGTGGAALHLLYLLLPLAAILDAFASARDEDVAPVRWLGGMWLIAIAFGAAFDVETLSGGTVLFTHYGDFIGAAAVLFTALGVAYPVLRHRIVDLNIFVSRATVFTVVSAIIVGVFVAAEWGVAKMFEQTFGLSRDRAGLASQVLTLIIVLALGLSARSIHHFVEERLTGAFFRKRLQGLAAIERVAREADAATDAADLMQLGVETVKHALNPIGVAYYLRRDDHYERTAGLAASAFEPSYRFNEAVPLRLRRWQEAFEVDDDSADRLHMLFVPMTVRGDLIGFLCCGPKPDRTAYLEDETRALGLLAHHTAIAAALLPRTTALPNAALALATT